MKRKGKLVLSLILALMMIASTFVVAGNVTVNDCPGQEPIQPGVGLVVEKTIWDETCWTDPITANIGDDVRFNISISYYPVDTDPNDGDGVGYKAKELLVNDTFPPCLEYNDSLVIKHGDNVYTDDLGIVDGDSIKWYLTRDYGIELWDNDPDRPRTLYMEFNATVVSDGENINHVNVTGFETCGHEDLYDEDTATVNVPTPDRPDVDIEKYVWDENIDDWSEGPITAYEGDPLTFFVNVTNSGNVELTNLYVQDILPDFLLYGGPLSTILPSLAPGEYWTHEFTCLVDQINQVYMGDNFVNVTTDQGVEDEDTVNITVKPHFIFTKEVWNGTGWSHYKDSVRLNGKVRFRLTATYYGDDTMKCLVIGDYLDDLCLEYSETVEVNAPAYCEYPEIYVGEGEIIEICNDFEVELEEGMIVWDWRQVGFKLNDGESVEVIFDTIVTEYCDSCGNIPPQAPPKEGVDIECLPPCINPNIAVAVIWGCMECTPCSGYHGLDMAFVRCCPPPTTFVKKVRAGEGLWKDSIETVVGSTIDFKLELEYFGERNLSDFKFKDILPCILEYADNAQVTILGGEKTGGAIEPEISKDGKTLWWNLTEVNLTDGGKITITFKANVVGATGSPCCGGCEPCECINYAEVYAYYFCPPVVPKPFPLDAEVTITALSNCPPSIPQLTGDTSGEVDETLSFDVFTTDSDGDRVSYTFDWDGETQGLGLYTEGIEQTITHSWDSAGTYEVRVKATDEHGAESDWSYPLTVTITETPEEADLSISINMFNFGLSPAVTATVKNTGDLDLTDVQWNMTITKGLIMKKTLCDTGDVIASLEGGASKTISSNGLGLKFNIGSIKVTAEAPGDITAEATATAIFLGPIVIAI